MVKQRKFVTVDGNEAAAHIAHLTNEVIAIYPITPASPMGELADAWSAARRPNLWGVVPEVIEMQSEGGAAGAVHGALQTGALTTTFTASQGLLLMIPNMYKIAGELTPTVFHVAARAIATHALSIFGDHSDVMSVRQTGWAMLCSSTVQESHDFALVSQAATLSSARAVPAFLRRFPHVARSKQIELLDNEDVRASVDRFTGASSSRSSGADSEHPVLRSGAESRCVLPSMKAANPFYGAARYRPSNDGRTGPTHRPLVQEIFEYVSAADAERVIVMGSGAGGRRSGRGLKRARRKSRAGDREAVPTVRCESLRRRFAPTVKHRGAGPHEGTEARDRRTTVSRHRHGLDRTSCFGGG
ncbi:MAG: hypothetical protein R3C99_27440 [Pirellulaceae bacterium]